MNGIAVVRNIHFVLLCLYLILLIFYYFLLFSTFCAQNSGFSQSFMYPDSLLARNRFMARCLRAKNAPAIVLGLRNIQQGRAMAGAYVQTIRFGSLLMVFFVRGIFVRFNHRLWRFLTLSPWPTVLRHKTLALIFNGSVSMLPRIFSIKY